jgi:hypothetical protein
LPENAIIRVTIPYNVEFIRHRRRTPEGAILWDDGDVAIRTVTAAEAPIAYQITPGDDGFGPRYDIRSFNGKLWWSLADTAFAPSVEHYIASVTDSGSCFLSMMNLSPASIDSLRQTTAQFDNDMSISRILKSSKDERWILANRVANHTLFCDDLVYVQGGPPAFFGITCRSDTDAALTFEIGSLHPNPLGIFSHWLPGPPATRRSEAACRSLVFRIEDIESEISDLELKGFRPAFHARATACMNVSADLDPSEIYVDALVRRAFNCMNHETAHKFRTAMKAIPLPPTTGITDRSVCRNVLHEMAQGCAPELTRPTFGFEHEWVVEAIRRLDARFPPLLTAEDAEGLLWVLSAPS